MGLVRYGVFVRPAAIEGVGTASDSSEPGQPAVIAPTSLAPVAADVPKDGERTVLLLRRRLRDANTGAYLGNLKIDAMGHDGAAIHLVTDEEGWVDIPSDTQRIAPTDGFAFLDHEMSADHAGEIIGVHGQAQVVVRGAKGRAVFLGPELEKRQMLAVVQSIVWSEAYGCTRTAF